MTVDNHLKCRTYPLLATNIYFTTVTMGCAILLMYIYSGDNSWWCHPTYIYGGTPAITLHQHHHCHARQASRGWGGCIVGGGKRHQVGSQPHLSLHRHHHTHW